MQINDGIAQTAGIGYHALSQEGSSGETAADSLWHGVRNGDSTATKKTTVSWKGVLTEISNWAAIVLSCCWLETCGRRNLMTYNLIRTNQIKNPNSAGMSNKEFMYSVFMTEF